MSYYDKPVLTRGAPGDLQCQKKYLLACVASLVCLHNWPALCCMLLHRIMSGDSSHCSLSLSCSRFMLPRILGLPLHISRFSKQNQWTLGKNQNWWLSETEEILLQGLKPTENLNSENKKGSSMLDYQCIPLYFRLLCQGNQGKAKHVPYFCLALL